MSSRIRSAVVFIAGGVALAFIADVIVRTPGFLVPYDFLEYWAAGRINLRGDNPYDPDALLLEQRRANPERERALMMWNPPPALAVYMPLDALPPRWAALVWVVAQFVAVLVACDLLWRAYCPSHRWVAAVVAVSFVGTWWLVAYGQNTGFMVLGLAGFLHFTRRNRPLAAGACAALTAFKPHLLACFGVLLVADAVTRRGAKGLGAGVAVIALALGAAVVANPNVIGQFVEAVRHPAAGAVPLPNWGLPVAAYEIRCELAPGSFWVQFVPCALACAAFLALRARRGTEWDWARALPSVLAVSVLTTPYGGWIFDLPVLLVPVVWAAARLVAARRWWLVGAFVAGQAAITAVSLVRLTALEGYWWVAPAALALCLLALPNPPAPFPQGTGENPKGT